MMQFPCQRNIWKKRIKNGTKKPLTNAHAKQKKIWIKEMIMLPSPQKKQNKKNNNQK